MSAVDTSDAFQSLGIVGRVVSSAVRNCPVDESLNEIPMACETSLVFGFEYLPALIS